MLDMTTQTVFVYHEYTDDQAFGTMLCEVYGNIDAARARLKSRVEDYFGKPWDELTADATNHPWEDDTFTPDYVSCIVRGACAFWTITEACVLAEAKGDDDDD